MAKWMAMVLVVTSGAMADSYQCVGEQTTGFAYNQISGDWDRDDSQIQGSYLVSKAQGTEAKQFAYVVTAISDPDLGYATCRNAFDEQGALSCLGLAFNLEMNRATGRMIVIQKGHFLEGTTGENRLNPDSVVAEVGKCTPF